MFNVPPDRPLVKVATVPIERIALRACVTPSEAIAAAAAAGITLTQPDPHSTWLSDQHGKPVFWWAAGGTLYIKAFASPTKS